MHEKMKKKIIEILDEKYELEISDEHIINFPCFSINLLGEERIFDKFDRYFIQNESYTESSFDFVCLVSSNFIRKIIDYKSSMTYMGKIKMHKSNNSEVLKYRYGTSKIYLNVDGSFVLYINQNKKNEFLFLANNVVFAQRDLLRVIREFYYEIMEQNNHIMMHCAAAGFKNNGYLICGEKGSGKTTTLTGIIEAGADYIGNDRIFLEKQVNNCMMSFFPLPIRIGVGTMRNTDIYQKIKDYTFDRKQEIANYHDEDLLRPGFPIKYELTPREFNELFNCQSYMQIPLKCIIFPNYNPNINNIEVLPILKENALTKLLQCCMTPRDDDWPNRWIFDYNYSKLELIEQAVEFLESIVEKIPIFEVRFGNATDFKSVLDELEKRRKEHER